MIVTKIEPITKTKFKIELDGEFAFVLYKGELSHYSIKEGAQLSEELLGEIKTEALLKRAKLRALHLLNASPRTESGLRRKLKENLYPDDIIGQAMDYVKSFGYVDDYQYAFHFIECRKETKSRREIFALLSGKGIHSETLDKAFEDAYSDGGDQAAIRKILEKKKVQDVLDDQKELQKIYAYLVRKGFSYEDIRQVVRKL